MPNLLWPLPIVNCGLAAGGSLSSSTAAVLLLLLLWLTRCSSSTSLSSQILHGWVDAGNYSYYKLSTNGSALLLLHSLTGDADMYISSRTKSPTFEASEHEMAAYTCGLDSMVIDASIGRPVYIGIYGYPASVNGSEYLLRVLMPTATTSGSGDSDDNDDSGEPFDFRTAILPRSAFEHPVVIPSSGSGSSSFLGQFMDFLIDDDQLDSGGGGGYHRGANDGQQHSGTSLLEILASLLKLIFEIVIDVLL